MVRAATSEAAGIFVGDQGIRVVFVKGAYGGFCAAGVMQRRAAFKNGLRLHFKHCHFRATVVASFADGDRRGANIPKQEPQRRQGVVVECLIVGR